MSLPVPNKSPAPAHGTLPVTELTAKERATFREALMVWYRAHARTLPWRGVRDPYRTWLSEIMLQQTRVNAVIDHYARFLRRFPTVVSLALASEEDVLALWSGLGYYRRARMLHRAAQLVVEEHGGALPNTATELRRLPGVGAYTSAAVASIAFGEQIAVIDGNVERVLLRITGRPEAAGAQAADVLNRIAQSLVTARNPGDHNQAMMELGATVCVPRNPHCDECPVFALCRTRGEHPTPPRARLQSERIAYGLCTRKMRESIAVEVLLQRRPADASRMPGMLELPQIELDPVTAVPTTKARTKSSAEKKTPAAKKTRSKQALANRLLEEPVMRVRHAIVGTNYYAEVYALRTRREVTKQAIAEGLMEWVPTARLPHLPLTGLARKVLQRLRLMKSPVAEHAQEMPLLIGRGGRAATADEA
jgi:A/G-specific adenine glycosylase